MATISETLTGDHRACDDVYADAEEAVGRSDWQEAVPLAERFVDLTRRHLAFEEQALFPAWEARTGLRGGPTAVMRLEHGQMRELLDALVEAARGRDAERFLGAGETLVVLMQQHNYKEENVLYPLMDERLGDATGLLATLHAP